MAVDPVMLAFAVSWHMAVPVCNQSTSWPTYKLACQVLHTIICILSMQGCNLSAASSSQPFQTSHQQCFCNKAHCVNMVCAVQAPQAGEAVEFLIEEGKPVEFREEVVSLAPFFGGHIIGDAKYS